MLLRINAGYVNHDKIDYRTKEVISLQIGANYELRLFFNLNLLDNFILKHFPIMSQINIFKVGIPVFIWPYRLTWWQWLKLKEIFNIIVIQTKLVKPSLGKFQKH